MNGIMKLQPGKYYHIYNCGINGENIFINENDYTRFLHLYEKYIIPVCETYAWVLMKNHFHLLVRMKKNICYKYSPEDFENNNEKFNELRWDTICIPSDNKGNRGFLKCYDIEAIDSQSKKVNLRIPILHLHFAHLFNAYAKYFNKKYERHGSLFERPFKRKEIEHINYFRRVVIYIHQNPVHHGFCDHVLDYGWSSYLTCISMKPTNLGRDEVIGWFDNVGNFKTNHNAILDRGELENYLGL